MSTKKKLTAPPAIKELMQRASSEPDLIPTLLRTLNDKGAIRFKAAKDLQIIAQADPALLYPYFNVFAGLLDLPNGVLLWNGIIILSYLSRVDAEKRFDAAFDKYYAHLWDGKLITAANVLVSSGRIAHARPDLADRITNELLKADVIPLPTDECREVARGHVLTSFAEYMDRLKNNRLAIDFISRCIASHRPAVKKQAAELLKAVQPA